MGFGIFLIWVKSLSFLNYYPYDLMGKTLEIALPILMRVMAGVLPYIIGIGFLYITLFWKSRDYF
jgi:hypothetical protein